MRRVPRKHPQPKVYLRCGCCGELYPQKYPCRCEQSKLIARVFELFPGTVEVTDEQLRSR